MLKRENLTADLCVIGGGMAGICTAIAAAREGINVVLVHERPVLGGNASSEVRMWVCGAQGENNRETGIIEEIMLESLHKNPTKNYHVWDALLYDFVKREKNITLLLNCTCMDAKCNSGEYAHGRTIEIESVSAYQLTTQKFFDIKARFFADCSGDSILAPLTGAAFRLGRESADEFGENTHVKAADTKVMGTTCLLQGRETEKPVKFTPPGFAKKLTDEDFKNRPMDLYNADENFWYLELGGNTDTIGDAEKVKDELLGLSFGAWDYLKNNMPGNENWELEFMSFIPAKRESRRMTGEYIVTQNDITCGTVFEDTVAYGGWSLDDHEPDGYYHKGEPNTSIDTPAPYCLPYRALYSKNVSNLLFAGRNISMTHAAMSSIRVMATCGILGQAAGTAAAVAVGHDCSLHDVYLKHTEELRGRLMDNDCFIPYYKRNISELCKNTAVIGGSAKMKDGEDRPNRIYASKDCGASVENGKSIEYRFSAPEKINAIHIVFDSDLNRVTLPGDWVERTHATRSNILLSSPQMHMPETLCREFELTVECESGEEEKFRYMDNIKRSYHFNIGKSVRSISLKPLSNWGGSRSTNIFSFDFN